ncbi:cellulose-binding family II [Acidimicrobium ferrooxidans DSM 10331]|uniref:cellulase n=1 Tax=Acidimicrobium ferrooxidans (strain DSM 10331 / JCM 15462 / NBRC 103882 / ICP) TaxID=525909 RepID=C7M2B9_ACIFD|nr:cellulose binding domain-containing protein [Acidimicrobium ferrooxidans]ACU54908.1 cellulose-binding family II [Acidimicrobium ferrooxidans DSM 10331]
MALALGLVAGGIASVLGAQTALTAAATAFPATPPGAVSGPFQVRGNVIVDAAGAPVYLHGVDWPSLVWNPDGQWANASQSGVNPNEFVAMAKQWGANAVRIPVNEAFWLKGSPEYAPGYIATVESVVSLVEHNGMIPIIDLHRVIGADSVTATPSANPACAPDVPSETFWQQAASIFKGDPNVMFELYNEPHDIPWSVWRNGGAITCADTGQSYTAVGEQQLLDIVRATGAENVVIVDGNHWAGNLAPIAEWGLAGANVAYGFHLYVHESTPTTPSQWSASLGTVPSLAPVVATEFGVLGCATPYPTSTEQSIVDYLEQHGIGWTAWGWFAGPNGGSCSFPSLIANEQGTPFDGGVVVQQQSLGLASGAVQANEPAAPSVTTASGSTVSVPALGALGQAYAVVDETAGSGSLALTPVGAASPETIALSTGQNLVPLVQPGSAVETSTPVALTVPQGATLTGVIDEPSISGVATPIAMAGTSGAAACTPQVRWGNATITQTSAGISVTATSGYPAVELVGPSCALSGADGYTVSVSSPTGDAQVTPFALSSSYHASFLPDATVGQQATTLALGPGVGTSPVLGLQLDAATSPETIVISNLTGWAPTTTVAASTMQASTVSSSTSTTSSTSTAFAPYVDMTLPPTGTLAQLGSESGAKALTLAFIVSSKGTCYPSWGNYFPVGQNNGLFRNEIAAYQAEGGTPIVSFGGEINQELAQVCSSPQALAQAYETVINTYHVYNLDFDIEGSDLNDQAAVNLRNQALALVQQQEAAQGHPVSVSYTLPVMPWGLLANSLYLLNSAKTYGVDVSNVNVMAMDYGIPQAQGAMGTMAIEAAQATEQQLASIWSNLSTAQLWQMVGVTPMIGQNDLSGEIFTTQDAQQLGAFAEQVGLGRLSMWEIHRDVECANNADEDSNYCSGTTETPWQFSQIFEQAAGGSLPAPSDPTPPPSDPTPPPSNPTPAPTSPTTPGPISFSSGSLAGTATVTSTWWGGGQVDVTIKNTGTAPVSGWTLGFTVPSGESIGSLWNGTVSGSTGTVTVTPASWNGTIEPGASIQVGFTLNGGPENGVFPSSYELSGSSTASDPAPTTPTPTPTSSGQLTATATVTSTWWGGGQVDVTIKNTGTAPVSGWTLGFTVPSGESIGSLWNGTVSGSTGTVTVTPASWNGTIEPGASIQVGFTIQSSAKSATLPTTVSVSA